MRKLLTGTAILAGVLAWSPPAAKAGRLIPVSQVPGSDFTEVSSINDNTEITGDASFDSNGIVYREAFIGTLDGQYTTFYEGDDSLNPTYTTGINREGYVSGIGYYEEDPPQCGHGFVRAPDGTITDVTRDGAIFPGHANGITQRENFVGWSCELSGGRLNYYGYYGRGTTYRADLVLPFNTDHTKPAGLSKKDGIVVGGFSDNDLHTTRAFILEGGVATAFDYPDPKAVYTFFGAINDKGMISGGWSEDLTVFHAFLFDSKHLRIKVIDPKGATSVTGGGINNAGLVALNVDYLPYIYCSRKSTCPASPKAIDVNDRWVPVPGTALHMVICQNGCLKARAKRS